MNLAIVGFNRDEIIDTENGSVAKVHPGYINLFTASPDLLAALKILRVRHQIDDPHHADLCEFCKLADAAIVKAEAR